MLNSAALTKVQSAVLISLVVLAGVGGSGAYLLLNRPAQSVEPIRIGICADLDNSGGERIWKAAILAAEHVNAAGGVLVSYFTIVAEDDDDEASKVDTTIVTNAMNRLINVDKANFVFSAASGSAGALAHQDSCAEQKEILFFVRTSLDEPTQRVVDDYNRYKYTFRFYLPNSTAYAKIMANQILTLGKSTGLTKVALLGHDSTAIKQSFSIIKSTLAANGFEIVYTGYTASGQTDFTSYLSAAEETGAQILVPWFVSTVSATFVKEWADRQSPSVVMGFLGLAGDSNFWELTEGKCESVSFISVPAVGGYPLTGKTQAALDSYFERWGDKMPGPAPLSTYDAVRYVLPDAIKRAGTIETEAVIKALETTDVETSMARHFSFGSSHDVMLGAEGMKYPAEDYLALCFLQWQGSSNLKIVAPETLAEEAATTYTYPSWEGPWGDRKTP